MKHAYWMVHNPRRGAPTKQHQTLMAAEQEAKRLAVANPGEAFVVLEAKCAFMAPPAVQRIELDYAIPF